MIGFLLEDRDSISYDAQYSAWFLGFPPKNGDPWVNPRVDVTKSNRY
jgi:hypothetical protein